MWQKMLTKIIIAFNFLLLLVNAQQFRNVTVKVISEDEAIFLHESRAQETYYLDEDKWYTGGDRIKGDTLRSDLENNYEFGEMRDFYFELKYPKQNDFYITHVSAFVQQSSTLGKAYIVDGGIGKK